MNTLFPLEDYSKPPSQASSETSVAAASAIGPAADRLREMVYQCIKDRGERGATRQEIERALDMGGDTVRPRCWELLKAGRIIETDKRRQTASGRAAAVLVVNKA